jgi:hypothetical protein
MQKDEKERGNGQTSDGDKDSTDRGNEEEWSKKDKKPTPDSNPATDKTKKN